MAKTPEGFERVHLIAKDLHVTSAEVLNHAARVMDELYKAGGVEALTGHSTGTLREGQEHVGIMTEPLAVKVRERVTARRHLEAGPDGWPVMRARTEAEDLEADRVARSMADLAAVVVFAVLAVGFFVGAVFLYLS